MRRVVLVAEVAAEDEPVPMSRVLSVHADLPGAGPHDDLAWFATQEIDAVLGDTLAQEASDAFDTSITHGTMTDTQTVAVKPDLKAH